MTKNQLLNCAKTNKLLNNTLNLLKNLNKIEKKELNILIKVKKEIEKNILELEIMTTYNISLNELEKAINEY